ncbi:hypothetical protein NQ318_008324 [Aromia moschata]|uniref:Uncharacterized protein n=1 Tax=Aromia moschata TaxID=1265417 RepID=A0AAV8XWY2_9CUCU|nr:hypothetical protein NQ318_008324 [Aromia moschata]
MTHDQQRGCGENCIPLGCFIFVCPLASHFGVLDYLSTTVLYMVLSPLQLIVVQRRVWVNSEAVHFQTKNRNIQHQANSKMIDFFNSFVGLTFVRTSLLFMACVSVQVKFSLNVEDL